MQGITSSLSVKERETNYQCNFYSPQTTTTTDILKVAMAEGGILSVNRVLCTNSPDNEDYYDTTRQFFSSSTFSLRFSVTFLSSPLLSLFDHIFPLGGGGGGDVNSKTIIIKFLTSRNVYCILFRFIFRLKLKNTQRFGPPTHPYLYLLPQWGCDQKRAR